MTSACRITTRGLDVTLGAERVLSDLDFACEPGQFTSLVGPSGCGKSTFLRCLAGLQRPTSGDVSLENGQSRAPRRAYVFQEPTLLPWRSVEQNIALPLELAGSTRRDRMSAARALAVQVGLTADDMGKRPHMLSGGMQMRVSLGRALSTQPELLLLDEPFAAIDDISRQQLNEQLLDLWQSQRWTAVFVTHNVSEAVFLSQRVLVMTAQPARVGGEVAIPLPYPRCPKLRTQPEFSRLVADIVQQLHDRAGVA